MKLVPFVADNVETALAQIHEQLGPDAVVMSVRPMPNTGISRLWHHSKRIEVLAAAPERKLERKKHSIPPGEDAYVPFEMRDERQVASGATMAADRGSPAGGPWDSPGILPPSTIARRWRSIAWLESLGLLTEFADRLEQNICATHGADPPPMPIAEWTAVRQELARFWRPARQTMEGTERPHVFIGPAGSGKSTVLCKWMTAAVLAENRSVHVWRLDGEMPNTSEFLSLHCELIGVPVSRFWMAQPEPAELSLVDLPGVELHNAHALNALREHVLALPQPHVHLVLNAAYETALLFEQFHAFAALEPEDLIFTHLDEERHRVKLWNFVLGTNCSLSFLSAGQKIPGDFRRAESALLFPRGIHL